VKRSTGIAAGVGLLVLSFGVAWSTPDETIVEAPFAAHAEIGKQTASQHVVATIREVSLAQEVYLDSWRGTTSGVWLVVEATAWSTRERIGIQADLFLDGARFAATGRADSSATIDGGVIDAGFTVSGPILIELPADVRDLPGAGSAVLRLGSGLDTRLDSVIELVIDLRTLEVDERVELEPRREGFR
jgi:hypothetical protein